jgi:hypothetical protein
MAQVITRVFLINCSAFSRASTPFAICIATFILAGCGDTDGLKRYRVTGTIKFKGSPIPQGFIQFNPDTDQGNRGPGGGASIVNGKYDAPRSKGIVGGAYIIRITGSDGVSTKENGEEIDTGKPLFLPIEMQHKFPNEDTTWDFDVQPDT